MCTAIEALQQQLTPYGPLLSHLKRSNLLVFNWLRKDSGTLSPAQLPAICKHAGNMAALP